MSLTVRELEPVDVDALQRLLETVSDYAERVTGYPTGPSDAVSTLISLPDGSAEDDKLELGLWDGDELVAFADVVRDFPRPGTALVALLVVRGDLQRRGLGRELHDAVLGRLAAWPELRRTRAGVVATNAHVADPFWAALGYRPTGEPKPYRYDHLETTVTVWERELADAHVTPSPAGSHGNPR